ncbi:MAG: TadE/TadG family type IV pilus assembly protein [Chloroflexota bacterium]
MRAPYSSRGQTLVEFALILPVFVVILVGIFDGGRLVFAYNGVNNAAREGGREATVNQTEADIQARAAQHAVALDIAAADVYVDFRCASSTPTCPWTPDDADSCDMWIAQPEIYGCLAVVRVTYVYTAATPVISALIGPISVTGEVRFPVEFNCIDQLPGIDCPLGQ